MATHHPPLSRLQIPHQSSPPILQPLYTAGLPTAIQQSFNMQTPLQSNFGHQVPPHPNPRHGMHRAHPSLMFSGPAAALAAAGIAPPSGMPVTTIGIPPHLMLGGPGLQIRNRRTPSMSTGGPPKAPLGGPNRKHSPMPAGPATSSLNVPAASEKPKAKKVILKLPVERVIEGENEPTDKVIYSFWSRRPLAHLVAPRMDGVEPPDTTSTEMHPMEQSISFPATIDVFLPGKAAWDEYKQKLIEEKLQRLGVEPGGNSVPSGQSHIHGRAASISSPADPALLLFKLNKLQQSQAGSISSSSLPSSIPVSPNPLLPPRFQNATSRHGHSFSLANFTTPPPQQPQSYNPTASFNPFGPEATLGSDQIVGSNQPNHPRDLPPHLHAPQGVVPLSLHMQSDTTTSSSGPSRVASTIPDFTRGFGLDIPEEDEEELEAFGLSGDGVAEGLLPGEVGYEMIEVEDDSTTAPAHSRHISRVSVALSLKSMGGRSSNLEAESGIDIIDDHAPELGPLEWNLDLGSKFERTEPGPREADLHPDPVGEWTASEDERSLEEFSNPSDEERALQVWQARREAKARRHSRKDQATPQRSPHFPRPPDGAPTFVQHDPSTADEDIVSNPSEEGRAQVHSTWLHPTQYQQDLAQYQPMVDGQLRSPRPLPPLPHSRTGSGNNSLHSAMMHSRHGSSMFNDAEPPMLFPGTTSIPMARRDSLNPFAKPFVFGPGSFSNKIGIASQLEASAADHDRQQQSGRALNATAAEFKPTGFTFRPPEGVPTLSFDTSEISRPLPQVPVGISPSRFQGREKRQRRGSSVGEDGDEEEEDRNGQEMSSFRFPPSPSDNPNGLHAQSAIAPRAISPLPKHRSELNATAPPFKFPGTTTFALPSILKDSSTFLYPLVPSQSAGVRTPIPDMQTQSEPGVAATPEADTKEISSETAASIHPSPSPLRKRPPVLDFKHPVSTNTVPAALFRKALAGTDMEGPTRASVRSRLSSREIFDHMNSPSLDDTNVPTISRKSNALHQHLIALQGRPNLVQDQPDDIFAPNNNDDADSRAQRLQVPTSAIVSPVSELMHTSYMKQLGEADYLDKRLENLLDNRMKVVKKDLAETQALATDQVVGQVITAIRTHVSELAARRLDEGAVDARGEIDFELVRNTLEQGVMDIRTGLRRDLEEVLRSVELANISRERSTTGLPTDFQRIMEDFGNRTVSAVTNAVVKFASRIDQIDEFARVRAADERELLLGELFNVLSPRLESFHQKPIDFDVVTAKLAEAVKPHISQLIDLTSDKKETAVLIVQRLMPVLSPLLQTPAHVDTDAIVSQLRVEVARMAPASDPHVIKEAVADLVVERLDSRLAVREKSASSENLYSRISERIDDLHAPVSDVRKAVEDLRMGQESIREQGATFNTLHQDMAAQLLSLPGAIESAIATMKAARDQWAATPKNGSASTDMTAALPHLESIESAVHSLATNHEYLASQAASLISLHEDLKNRVSILPQSLNEATASLKQAQVEFFSRSDTLDQSSVQVKNLLASNAELQVQIAKARGAHGQIRVEKDLMCDRMTAAESDRDALRTQLEELKSKGSAKETEVAGAGLRITELEDALSHSLARLQSSDVTAKAKEDRIASLERQNRDLGLEQYQFKSQIQKLDLQSEWLARDKETLEQRLSQLQKDHDALANQQSHWEELRRTSEQVEQLTRLIGAADSEEVAELKRERDRCKVLEGEYTSLQKRFKDQEVKCANLDRASQTTRQSLAQAQQRASEWEKRTKELEAELDATRARLDDADEAKLQLDSDFSLVKMHLEEKEAAEKLAKRESKMCAQVSSLEAQLVSLTAELEKTRQARLPTVVTAPTSGSPGWGANGHTNGQEARPSSRASTVYGGRSPVTPTDVTHRTDRYPSHTPSVAPDSPKGVWESMHAPRAPAHRASNTLPYPPRSAIPSPTPSTVSLAPTQGDDGWWS